MPGASQAFQHCRILAARTVTIHTATVVWTLSGDFKRRTYSRAHVWTFDGGAVVAASSSPHNVPLPYSNAAGVDPEEGLLAATSSCHMLWFLDFAVRAGFTVERYEDRAEGVIGRDDRGLMAFTAVTLNSQITFTGEGPDMAGLAALHAAAHKECFVGNSLRCEVVVAG